MNNLQNKMMSGESSQSKLLLDLIDSKERDQLLRNILRFHLKMHFPLFKIDKYSFSEVPLSFILKI